MKTFEEYKKAGKIEQYWTDKDAESEWMYMGEDGIGGHL